MARNWACGSRGLAGLVCGMLALGVMVPTQGFAGDDDDDSRSHKEAHTSAGSSSMFAVKYPLWGSASDTRSDIFAPIVSFLVPGADQWWLGQTVPAMFYTGAAIGGLYYAAATQSANNTAYAQQLEQDKYNQAGKKYDPDVLDEKDVAERKITLGQLVYQGAGGMSLYHAFRSSVRTRKEHGQYDFLTHEETPLDLYMAPLHFQYLARPTTLIPLAVGAGLVWLQVKFPGDNMVHDRFTTADASFAASYSYNAGTHEEAIFRGWFMPVLREYTGSDFGANAIQSLGFAAAHLNNVSQPIAQLLLGYDLGYVSQKNGWQLGEGCFIHAWWDVMAFVAQYQYKMKEPDPVKASLIHPVMWLPPFEYLF